MSTTYSIVLCSCPDTDTATVIAGYLVTNKLAACVNVVPNVLSIYTWQGNTEQANEQLLVIKTKTSRYNDIEEAILDLHPYELPEIISVPIDTGLSPYLNWIDENVLP